MNAYLKKKRRWPYLDIYISIPFFEINTQILRESIGMDIFNWVVLYIKIFKQELKPL